MMLDNALPRTPWTCRWGRGHPSSAGEDVVEACGLFWTCDQPQQASGRATGSAPERCERCERWEPREPHVLSAFRGLASEGWPWLAALATVRCYAGGEALFREGAPSDSLHAIASGRVKVSKAMPSGKEIILQIAGPGDPIGTLVDENKGPYLASAVALEPTTCVVIPRRSLFVLLERCPPLASSVLTGVTRLLSELMGRAADVSEGRVEVRLARIFLRLADNMGQHGSAGIQIPLALSRQDLADLSGTRIETCIRIMSRWGRANLVRTANGGFVLVNTDALRTLASGHRWSGPEVCPA